VVVPAPEEPVTATTGCFLDIDAPYRSLIFVILVRASAWD